MFMLLFVVAGCDWHKSDGDGGSPPLARGSISGKVVSATTGEALAGASIRADDVSTISGLDGTYTLSPPVGDRIVINIDAAGFAETTQVTRVVAEEIVQLDIKLLVIGVAELVDVATGGTVVIPNSSAQISIPANGLIPLGGGSASASVNVALTAINPAIDPDVMPGDFTAVLAGDSTPVSIESFGALRVDVRDDNGERYTLVAGQSAEIRIPVGTLSDSPPATIPLLIFNETTGLWVEEGSATLAGIAPDQFYVGTVQRFGAWNADKRMDTIFVSGCVRDTADQTVSNVRVTSKGINYSGSASTFTDIDGNFRVAMRRDALATISVSFRDADQKLVTTSINVGPFTEDVALPDCIVTEPVPLQIIQRSLPGGLVGRAYSAGFTAVNGTLPYEWSVTFGDLPTGLTLNSTTGLISGTPTAGGSFNGTIQVEDSASPSELVETAFFIFVNTPPPFNIATGFLPAGTVDIAYNSTLVAVNGTTPYDWSVLSGDLPSGLSLSASGQISGTPTSAGTFSPTIQVLDNETPAQSATAVLSIVISPGSGPAPPAAPTGVGAFSEDAQVRVVWNAVTDADTYTLYMASVSGVTKDNYSTLADGVKLINITSPYIQTGLVNGTTYYFVVTADNATGESAESREVSATPVPNTGVSPMGSTISAGTYHSCARLDNGTVRCWGLNFWGLLGNGNNTASTIPVEVSGITTATAISVGLGHSCALLGNGTVQCWGFNGSGELGDGSTTVSNIPVEVSGLTTATAISSGNSSSCARLENGTVQCWGLNSSGQLGNGTTITSLTPVEVSGLTTVTAVSSGSAHSCARLENGTVQCWGLNNTGQLGDGTNTTSLTPVQVSGLITATVVSSGSAHSCARLENGTIQCWGLNSNGQLGDDTATSSLTPVEVSGISTATAVTTSDIFAHSCARLENGTLQCWGYNLTGQLGDGTVTSSLTPVEVSGITTATEISAGYLHTCAGFANGTVQCWGYNGWGQLGDGSNATSLTPVQVSGLP